jgi:hypothetical protein
VIIILQKNRRTGTEKQRNLVKLLKVEGEGEVVPVLNEAPRYEVIWGSGGIAPNIFNLGTGW